MDMTPEDAIQLLESWKQQDIVITGFMQTPALQLDAYSTKPFTGPTIHFRGQIDHVTNRSLAIKLLGGDTGNLLFLTTDADYVYREHQQGDPVLQMLMQHLVANQNDPSPAVSYEQVIEIYAGYIYRDDVKVAPLWMLMLLKPMTISPPEFQSDLVM